jgi:hypothetical protein
VAGRGCMSALRTCCPPQAQRQRQMDAVYREGHTRMPWRGKGNRSLAAVPLGFLDATAHGRGSGKHVRDPSAPEGPEAADEHNLLHRVGGSLPSLRWRAALLAREGVVAFSCCLRRGHGAVMHAKLWWWVVVAGCGSCACLCGSRGGGGPCLWVPQRTRTNGR